MTVLGYECRSVRVSLAEADRSVSHPDKTIAYGMSAVLTASAHSAGRQCVLTAEVG